ncbi:ABC transporter substrate-binding protein [Bacillaceae bacterium Marseille-Q3522]|nr:ABC transporter substrate-binding protein [Bacillaceae bacterium Marseille-Q3522]
MMRGLHMRKFYKFFTVIIMALLLAACNQEETGGSGKESSENSAESVKLVLNWFPKSQHGGVYAAQEQGIFTNNGLDVTIEPGGPQVSAIQIVSSGSADFGLVHADQMVIAKNQGIDLVAVAAAMQGSPQAFMFHKDAGINSIDDLNGRNVFIQPGITYWDYIKSKYDVGNVKEMTYTGEHTNFIADKESVIQSFVTSEPFAMQEQEIDVETLLVSESGYDPYNIVLFVTKDYLEKNRETVQKMVSSFVEGWNYFKDSPDGINQVISELNPDMSLEAFAFETEEQKEFIFGGDAAEHGVGYMTEERWETLKDQLLELGLLEEDFDVNEIFTTEFLPH